MKTYAYCWASGLIQFGTKVPEGAIAIASGERQKLVDLIEVTARHAYDGKSLLVPGVPEASDQAAAGDALDTWLRWLDSMNTDGVNVNRSGSSKR